jgi:hypothetical protein
VVRAEPEKEDGEGQDGDGEVIGRGREVEVSRTYFRKT